MPITTQVRATFTLPPNTMITPTTGNGWTCDGVVCSHDGIVNPGAAIAPLNFTTSSETCGTGLATSYIVTTANGDTLGRGSLPVAQQACVAAAPTTGSTTHMSGGVATEVSTSQTVASTVMNFGVFASIGALFTVFGFVAVRKR